MTALEIQEDELEELLIYEDLFLEYFNEFLSLPAFPVRLMYNRLTGNVQELDDLLQEKPVGYGANDLQREKTLLWLRKERLCLFRKSPLYLEYKLAKLLLRPLEAPRSLSRYGIHGYSRQSNSVALSSLPSNPPTANHHFRAPLIQPEPELTVRMPSRPWSMPAATGYSSEAYSLSLLEQYGDTILHLWGFSGTEAQDDLLLPTLGESGDEKDLRSSVSNDQEQRMGAECVVQDRDLVWSDTDDVFTTTEEEEQFLKQHNLTWSSLQQLKEDTLGTREGMSRFKDFLQDTLGSYLFHFWVDCEEFKEYTVDLEAIHSPEESRYLRMRLFRCIQSKYQMYLSAENLEQIRISQLNWGPTFHAFRRSQYDALRRLRSYWIPRFLIHQKRSQHRSNQRKKAASDSSGTMDSFPPINKSRSGPNHTEPCSQPERKKKHKMPSEAPDPLPGDHVRRIELSGEICSDPLLRRMCLALQSDREAGGAFLHYLKRYQRILKNHQVELQSGIPLRSGAMMERRGIKRRNGCCQLGELHYREKIPINGPTQSCNKSRSEPKPKSNVFCVREATPPDASAFLNLIRGVQLVAHNRFESPQKTQALLLWKELGDFNEWESQPMDNERPWQAAGFIDHIPLGPNAFHAAGASSPFSGKPPKIPNFCDSFPAVSLSDLVSLRPVVMAALCQPWIRFLRYDITAFLEFCVPPRLQEDMELTGTAGSHREPGKKRNKKERERGSFTIQGGKVNVKRKKEKSIFPGQESGTAGDHQQDAETLKEMLQHRAIYKVYRKVVQDTEEPEMLKALELLHTLMESKGDRRLLGLMKKTLELDVLLSPYTKGLRKRLENELLKGRISRSTLEETTSFLSSLLAESFGKFWAEMSGRLMDYGVEMPGGEGWARIQPILKVIATKIVLKHLHGRKSKSCQPVKTLPSAEDIGLFHQALHTAAQGWPTPEVLHFLRHLQTHGPQEGLPLLENNLLCCLEVQKYKNIHHHHPDRGLLKRKVKVVKERFLLPQTNPILQLSPEFLQKTLQDTEAAEQSELQPPPTLFNHLLDALCDSLLPFWAGFRKSWLIRSPASAQRLPLLRVQQMLRRRLALFESEDIPTKTFHLPPLQNLPTRRLAPTVTFSFSISNGVTIKDTSDQERDSPTPQESRRMSQLPQISQMSLRTTQLVGTQTGRLPLPN